MNIKKSIQERIWILEVVLLVCSILTLNNFFFISDVMQNIYYGLYVVLSITTILIIHKYYNLSVHHGLFILFNLLLIYITYLNHFIALPFVLVFPLFCSRKSHGVFKFFSTVSYILLIILMFLTLFVRLIFTSTTLVKRVDSPNNKQMIEVYSIDEGALGGSTQVRLAQKYSYIFKKSRLIYSGHYGEANVVKWVDSKHVQIDGKDIDVTNK